MKYDFDTPVNRRGTGSLKWNVGEGELPLWVADMDFETAPEVKEAIEHRAAHGIYGYTEPDDGWYDAYIGWWRERHGLLMDRERLMFCTGIVPAISSIVRKLTTPNENVLLLTPVYNIFFNSVINNGARVLECPLTYDGGEYGIDFEALEAGLRNPQTTLMILCNPHNPVGKIWERETLSEIGRLCAKYHVTVISDEIHCDITEPGREYVPFASVSDECRMNSITCIAPTKAFNIAGLQSAAVYVPEPFLFHKIWRALNTDEAAEPNVFAVCAAEAAFVNGGEWLDELRGYISGNRKYAADFFRGRMPEVRLVNGEATYLLWADCTAFVRDSRAFTEFLRRETGLFISDGAQYGEAGEGFVRINAACPRTILADALERFFTGAAKYRN